jgi:hypothetical protein
MGYGYSTVFLVFVIIWVYMPCKELACRGEIILVYHLLRFRMMLIQIISRVYDNSLILHTHQTSIFGWYYKFDTYG